jgi:hypothetical protein
LNSRRVIIEISPSRLELAVVRGDRCVAWSVERFDRSDWPADWRGALEALAAPLASFVSEHGVLGWKAVVVYRLPTSIAQASSGPIAMAQSQQQQAACLAAASGVDGDAEAEDAESLVLAADAGDTKLRHVLAYADADETLAAIEALLTRCRLVPSGCVPMDAVITAHMAQLVQVASVGSHAALWIGDHQSVLGVVVGGDLRFVRPIGVGIETFVDAWTRPLRRPGESAPSVCLPRREGRRLLLQVGVPDPEDDIPGLEGFTGAAFLPLVQPLVQRICVDVKQSLRFAVSPEDRSMMAMAVQGPGSAIAGLGAALTVASGIASAGHAHAASSDSSVSGAIAALAADRSTPLLMSRELRTRRTMSRTRQAVLAGVAAALAVIGIEWLDAQTAIGHLRAQSDAARQVEIERKAQADALAAALADMQRLHDVRDRIRRSFGDAPDAPAVVAAIGAATPGGVTLSDVELQADGKVARAVVRGKLQLRPGIDAGGTIRQFVSALNATPIVSQARLGRTSRVNESGTEGQVFEIAVDLLALPSVTRASLGDIDAERSEP